MIFKSIEINNFRNFENVIVALCNKNIFFGLNDVGKTNFLYAIRYILDKEIRKSSLLDSDYHLRNIKRAIEITLTIDISDKSCIDNQKLRAVLKGAILSGETAVYIKLKAEYDNNEQIGIPILYWGGNKEDLKEMKQRGYMHEIDYIFNTIYINAYVELNTLFKRNIKKLIINDELDKNSDENILNSVSETINNLNSQISSLSGIKYFEEKITPKYKKYRSENIAISIKSEMAVKGLYSNLVPYIKRIDDDCLYPTSGEGRKKLLTYSIFDLLSNGTSEKMINVFLIEEPENHLHKSMQIALSKILFSTEGYNYLFMSTHSSFLLSDMNDVNLIRVYNETKIDSKSTFYSVPDGYAENRNRLNRTLAEAIFADKVLLVEGESEKYLFEKILSVTDPTYEVDGLFILVIGGVGFESYFKILSQLNIKTVIKTDNDLKKHESQDKKITYSVLGFSRCNNLSQTKSLPTDRIETNTPERKIALYNNQITILNELRETHHIFLSKCDLEHDLDEVMHDQLVTYLENDSPVSYLQKAKHHHIIELINKLTDDDCINIYNHYNFACLKAVF